MSGFVAYTDSIHIRPAFEQVLVVLVYLNQIICTEINPRKARNRIFVIEAVPLSRNVEPVDESIDIQRLALALRMLAKRLT